jgi:ATP-dependent RNA helicase DeaD
MAVTTREGSRLGEACGRGPNSPAHRFETVYEAAAGLYHPQQVTFMESFEALGAHPTLLRSLQQKNYTQPTPVQTAVLAAEHKVRDLLVSAETGSGKTAAFGLALAPTILGEGATIEGPRRPRVLVLAPTRELAVQVQRELVWLYHHAQIRSVACVGGMGMQLQLKLLHEGVHLVVGTPGRLCDHIERGTLDLEELQALVIDEADEMLDMGFREELERIVSVCPKARRTLMFSATLPPDIVRLAGKWLRDPVRITASPPRQQHRDISYLAYLVAFREREHAVVNILRAQDAAASIVFCATRDEVNHLSASLNERGFSCVSLSGELAQAERTRALQALRDGKARVLVATDVAARGLDLPDVGIVIQASLPFDSQVMQHRAGRTGRAGRKGTAVMLVPVERRRIAERLFRDAGINPTWMDVPDAKSIRLRDEERLIETLCASEDLDLGDLEIGKRVLERVSPEALAARLVGLLRKNLPDPEDLPLTDVAVVAVARDDMNPRRFDRASAPPRRFRDEGGDRGDSLWFSLNVGRSRDADPKWIIPVLCKRGGITKADIGAIRILDHETRVEILGTAGPRFAEQARRPDKADPKLMITPAAPHAPKTFRGAPTRRGK